MSKGFDLCRLAGLVKLEPYPEMVLVGETKEYASELSAIYGNKYDGFVVVIFSGKTAHVRGLGLDFVREAEDRKAFISGIRRTAAQLTDRRIDVSFDEKLWHAYYGSQTIAGRKAKQPRKWMPKKFEKVTDIRFESAEFEAFGNKRLTEFS